MNYSSLNNLYPTVALSQSMILSISSIYFLISNIYFLKLSCFVATARIYQSSEYFFTIEWLGMCKPDVNRTRLNINAQTAIFKPVIIRFQVNQLISVFMLFIQINIFQHQCINYTGILINNYNTNYPILPVAFRHCFATFQKIAIRFHQQNITSYFIKEKILISNYTYLQQNTSPLQKSETFFQMQKSEGKKQSVQVAKVALVQQKKKPKWINPLRDRTRVIPFVVPNQQERKAALGSLVGEKWRIKRSIQAIYNQFDPIKKPEPGDNLWQKQEDGQDFPLFVSMHRNHIDPQTQIIYIAPFKCKLSKEALDYVKKKARKFFHGVKVKIHHFDQKIDMNQFDPMTSENGQTYYDAAKLNFYYSKHLPKKAYSIAVITSLLIYNGDNPKEGIDEKWVFGLGAIKDRTSWTSFEQIVKKGYGEKRQYQGNQQDESQENIEFLSKVINHQLCHTFGMKHCIYHTCLMNGTNGYNQAVKKVPDLCPICLRKLQYAIGFDIAQRYQAIGDIKSLQLAGKIQAVLK